MSWPNLLAAFFAGAFLANFVPHFVHGVSGNRFPTPFATARGIGLSSPLVNVLWALVNLAAGFFLLRAGKVSAASNASLAAFFAGVAALSIHCSRHFVNKHAG